MKDWLFALLVMIVCTIDFADAAEWPPSDSTQTMSCWFEDPTNTIIVCVKDIEECLEGWHEGIPPASKQCTVNL